MGKILIIKGTDFSRYAISKEDMPQPEETLLLDKTKLHLGSNILCSGANVGAVDLDTPKNVAISKIRIHLPTKWPLPSVNPLTIDTDFDLGVSGNGTWKKLATFRYVESDIHNGYKDINLANISFADDEYLCIKRIGETAVRPVACGGNTHPDSGEAFDYLNPSNNLAGSQYGLSLPISYYAVV